MAWFQLKANGTATDPNDYASTGAPTCSGDNHICAVQASPDANNKPILTPSLKDEMINALNNEASSTNVQLRNTR